ncbi:hypothetical protein QLS71_016270 [Mariniflexile litorale]|uniref:Uncharacterized protein n=1 Tax=Mariniflexile litorale TaxID=3045158 RepID=A0AAU7EEU1_9FLAO|nr:hypothetical protein [Mariniflexile sp. KMM 9835]MDQ8212299.1 hypothetical protein [Mariniflexile sp. KMM 9835]
MQRIQTDPAFANLKANMQEFAAASKLSKAIRTGFFETAMQFKDSLTIRILKSHTAQLNKRPKNATHF